MSVMLRLCLLFLTLFWSSLSFATEEFEYIANLMTSPLFQKYPTWLCSVSQQQICSSSGCKSTSSRNYIILKKLANNSVVYIRCDSKGCDSYSAEYNKSGIFTNVTLPYNATIFKAKNDGSEFVEVTMAGLTTFIGSGKCTASNQVEKVQ